jgi:hypothetical protein
LNQLFQGKMLAALLDLKLSLPMRKNSHASCGVADINLYGACGQPKAGKSDLLDFRRQDGKREPE